MIHKRIACSEELLNSFFPEKIAATVEDKKPFVYGAVDEESGDLVGACLFTVADNRTKTAIMHYCIVKDGFRREDIGSALVETAMKSLSKAGIKYVVYREISDNSLSLLESLRFATACDFLPGTGEEWLLYYSTSKLLSRLSVLEKNCVSQKIDKVKNTKDERVYSFNRETTDSLFRINAADFDPKLSNFYVEDGKIMAACLVRNETKQALINDIYISPRVNDINAYTSLMCSCVMTILRDPNIAEICIQAVGIERLQEIRRLLGDEREGYQAIDMVRYL
ncbi:MAG: GNAT family N-acetyltransferase [Lachnospiraceae bacterium]|nr:GNAT family N-acetyltransferase [Lachnospiraceae bacterium]